MNQSVEGGWRVVQPKRHHVENVQAFVRDDRSFRAILLAARNLVIDHQQIQRHKSVCIVQRCEDLIDSQKCIGNCDCHLVELPVIHTHSLLVPSFLAKTSIGEA